MALLCNPLGFFVCNRSFIHIINIYIYICVCVCYIPPCSPLFEENEVFIGKTNLFLKKGEVVVMTIVKSFMLSLD